ncbi:MAG: glycosyltransferase family 4 protein [Prevotella sp.]|nr:glycosyltransferase family 4 protein [Prevotella sp.]
MGTSKRYKIVFCTPALYSAGGVERVVSFKASYFAEQLGYDVTIIVTEGRGRDCYFPLSDQVKVINFELGFEALWQASFIKKIFLYLTKQRQYKRLLKAELMRIRPDITISMLRREINFLTSIQDGSRKIGELHVNRANYRNFEANDSNVLKRLFAKLWMKSLVGQLRRLDQLVVLTEKSKASWPELSNVTVIPDPIPIQVEWEVGSDEYGVKAKRVVTIGRYAYQKGYDLLLQAWAEVEKQYPDWTLDIYGQGNQTSYRQLMTELGVDTERCHLNGPVKDVVEAYREGSIFVLSSRFEGFGLVLVEAMACGLPVISFDCPAGPDEIITDGVDGLLAPSGDVHALAEKIMTLMADKDLRQRLAKQARQTARRYEMASLANQWQRLFETVTNNR